MKDREGRGGTGRDRGGKEGGRGGMGGGGEGRGARHGLRPLEIRPCTVVDSSFIDQRESRSSVRRCLFNVGVT